MKILIAVDDSTCSTRAVEELLERKWPDQTEVRVISVVEPVMAAYGFTGGYIVESMVNAEKEITQHCRHFVDEVVAKLRRAFGEDRVTGDVLHGFIADSIVEEARSWDADLIMVGSHGRRGFQRFLLGSVAERVAGHAPCSIEIVKIKSAHHDNQDKTQHESAGVAK